jgi:DNA-binding NtrC family response regulator
MTPTVLVVDDDPAQRRLLQAMTERFGFRALTAEGGQQALDLLEGVNGQSVSVVLLDLVMPGLDGLSVLKRLRPSRPNLPVIVLTAQGGVDTAVTAMRAGADDFLVKPASPERIQVSIQNALKIKALTGEIQRLKKRAGNRFGFADLIARSPAMREVLRMAERAAQSNIPILIEGESGVGKEVVARAIQGASDRAGKPFVTVNCGAIPDNLIESILFGHEKGSFTGAHERHIGKFQEAHGGTLFLDEIGELKLDMQVKLLRAIQEGEIDPVGGKKPVKIDIRLISATNRNLGELAAQGQFREDLYYRLNVFPVTIPPLRNRMDDLAALASHFIERFGVEENKKVLGLERNALDMLLRFNWPGNIRQLENAIFRAVVLCDTQQLRIADFPQIAVAMGEAVEAPAPLRDDDAHLPPPFAHQPHPAHAERGHASAQPYPAGRTLPHDGEVLAAAATTQAEDDAVALTSLDGHLRKLEEIERDMIRLAITRYDGQMSEVARRLGIGRSTLYRKLRDMGLDTGDSAAA